ncbi:MAG: cation diffusion facilitator family transporter [Lachnospiraceae bacterium]|jgi:cation diffusion facilitator family transporter
MITILAKILKIKQMPQEKQRSVYGMLCGFVGIFLNIVLFALKFLAGIISGAVSITADAFNNLSDAGSSIVTLLGFKLAGIKADREHPYGHGRMEYISGLVVSAIIIVMGFELFKESVKKIIHPEAGTFSWAVVFILILSILVKCYMAVYNFSIGNKINSSPVKATAIDSLSDCAATTAVLICLIISRFTGIELDGWGGCIVSLFILYAGYSAAKDSLQPLLGNTPDPEFIDKLKQIVLGFDDNILGLHDLMVHDYGPGRRIVSLHTEVPSDGDLLKIHDVIDNLEKKLARELGCAVTIHMDPVATNDPKVNSLRFRVAELLTKIDELITIHDFRVVWGETHTNLIFDMALPFECKYSDDEAKKMAEKLITDEIGANYYAVIDVDRDNYSHNG